jgi:hypothetical protein
MTFKELPINTHFIAADTQKIIWNRGDRPNPSYYGYNFPFIKRDEFGGHLLYTENNRQEVSVYYRIEPDNEVETFQPPYLL